ncbi:DUF732 domain-containing protein [Mycolicibacterium agri]|nr:DUF732 domain-containing protein [Mycolicibacterium agri]
MDHAFATHRRRLAANVKDGIIRGTKMAGRGACRLLYTGSGTQGAIDATAAQYGASPDQAAAVVNAARANFCTQAPG